MISPAFTNTCSSFLISSAATCFIILVAIDNFLLYLYLPTLAISYLLGSKNIASSKFLALSTVGKSPGRSLLYNSIKASSCVFTGSFCNVAKIFSSLSNNSSISASVTIPKALSKLVTGIFLVLSIFA